MYLSAEPIAPFAQWQQSCPILQTEARRQVHTFYIPSREITDLGTLCDRIEDGSRVLRSGQYMLFGSQF